MKQFMSRTWLPWVIVTWTFGISVARAIRLPNDFAEAHWLLDYRFGFMKRGLIGSLCSVTGSLFGFSMTPGIIVGLSAITAGAFYVALLVLLFRVLRRHPTDGNARLMALVFASSPFLVMNAHLFGYFDALLYALAIASIALIFANRPFLAALVSAVALLSHESYLFIGLPLVCLAGVLHCRSESGQGKWGRHLVALCIPVGVFILIVVVQSLVLDKLLLRAQLTEYLGSFDFIPTRSRSVAKWHTIGFFEYLYGQRGNLSKRLLDPTFLASLGPSFLALLYFIHAAFRLRPFAGRSLLLLGAVACPLALHAIAWDTARISSYVVGGAFIAAWIFTETQKSQGAGVLFSLLALPVIVLNVFMRIPLMDKEVERFSDWQRLWLYLPAFLLVLFTVMKKSESPIRPDSAAKEIPEGSYPGDE